MIQERSVPLVEQKLKLSAASIQKCLDAQVGPIIVGDCPGADDACHLIPYPRSSLAGKVWLASGLDIVDYMRFFTRTYLMSSKRDWRTASDNQKAAATRLCLTYQGHPLVLLGKAVIEAFGASSQEPHEKHGCWLLPLSHLDNVRKTLWQAADLWHNPGGLYMRRVCGQCGKLAQVHPPVRKNAELRIMCAGEGDRFCFPREELRNG